MQTEHGDGSFHHARIRYPSSRIRPSGRGEATINLPIQNIVSIAPEFYARSARFSSPDAELAAMHHLGQFLTEEPSLLWNQLTAAMLQVCDVTSAVVVLLQHSAGRHRPQWVSVAGSLAECPDGQFEWEAAVEAAIKSQQPGVFLRLSRTGASFADKPQNCECLVVPWELKSGMQGAIVVFSDCKKRCLDATDLRIAKSLVCFTKLAAERKEIEQRSARGFASAARLANEIAHEINNPLQALMNSLHLMTSDYADDIHLKTAREEVRRVANVVRGVLEVGYRKNPWA